MTEFNLAEIAIELEDFAKEKIIKEVEDHLNAFGFEKNCKS